MNLWYQRHKVLVWIVGVAGGFVLLYLASWVARIGLFVYLTGQVQALTGLDLWLSRAVAVVLTVGVLLLLPLLIPFYPKKKPLFVLAIVLAVGFCVGVYFAAEDVYFDPEGNTVKYYIRTPEGFKFSNSRRVDPTWGIRYEPITPQIAEEIGLSRTVHRRPVPPGTYFDPVTGAPLKNYYKDQSGKIELFSIDVRHHPKWGATLEPITPAVVREYEQQQKEQVEKPKIQQAFAQYRQIDSELNSLWRTEFPKLDRDSQNTIRSLEREWIDYKNRHCNAESSQPAGSAASYECLAQLTEKRIEELRSYFRDAAKSEIQKSVTTHRETASTTQAASSITVQPAPPRRNPSLGTHRVSSPRFVPRGGIGMWEMEWGIYGCQVSAVTVTDQKTIVTVTFDCRQGNMEVSGYTRQCLIRAPYYKNPQYATYFTDDHGLKYTLTGDSYAGQYEKYDRYPGWAEGTINYVRRISIGEIWRVDYYFPPLTEPTSGLSFYVATCGNNTHEIKFLD